MSYANFDLYTKFAIQHFNAKRSFKSEFKRRPDIIKVSRLIKNVRKNIKMKDDSYKTMSMDILCKWENKIDEEAKHLQFVSDEIQSFLEQDNDFSFSDVNIKPERFDVYWDDKLVWKMLRMLMVIDKICFQLGMAHKTTLLDVVMLSKYQKKIATPLRRVLSEIVATSKPLFPKEKIIY